MELFEENGFVASYTQSYVEIEQSESNDKQKVIPALIAIKSLVENYLPEGSVIADVQLGYHGQIYDSQTQFMLPSWRIVLDSRLTYYIQAFNGLIEIPQ
jgi:regulatory protein YycI of two-component signal transduction system YycFG